MADPGDVVDRADALMRRRRSFVAKPPEHLPEVREALGRPARAWDERNADEAAEFVAPWPGDAATVDEDDLPVLTDVVPIDDDGSGADNRRQARIDDTQVALLASEIAHAIGEQLAGDLPKLIEAALVSAGEELSRGIGATMETALRDFIARRRQLALPLDEPHGART